MDESIRTQFDDLLASLKAAGGKSMSASELSSKCSMPHSDVLMWLSVLEKTGQVRVENRLGGVYANWSGAPEPRQRDDRKARGIAHEDSISFAREREEDAKGRILPPESMSEARKRHQLILESATTDLVSVSKQLEKVDEMLVKLKEKRIEEEHQEQPVKEQPRIQPPANNKQKKAEEKRRQELARAEMLAEKERKAAEEKALREKEEQQKAAELLAQIEKEIEVPRPPTSGFEDEPAQFTQGDTVLPASALEEPEEASGAGRIAPIYTQRKSKSEKIKKPLPVQVTSVSLQFSDKLSRQIKKILAQSRELEEVRKEKEKLLTEHYLPMQRKLESEIETISDRVLRMEKNILALHQRAADLPGKVTSVEKLQQTSIKAHDEMRKAYDEASALIEESTTALSDEREKMEEMVEASRSEIAEHHVKTVELQKALSHISKLEEESANLVISARAALAEQAERLATAEKYSGELSSLKAGIRESVDSIKREISTTKGVLTNIQKQMEEMRHIELYAQSIRQDYEQRMAEVGDYIKHGNEEFDTLRESVEANFVRRYLRELRTLTDSYSFEFGQVKAMEGNLEARMAEEKKRLEELIEEGRKISYIYETQSREVAGEGKFEERAQTLKSIGQLSQQRSQLQSVIAQVVGKEREYEEEIPAVSTGRLIPKVQPVQRKKAVPQPKKPLKAKKGKKR